MEKFEQTSMPARGTEHWSFSFLFLFFYRKRLRAPLTNLNFPSGNFYFYLLKYFVCAVYVLYYWIMLVQFNVYLTNPMTYTTANSLKNIAIIIL